MRILITGGLGFIGSNFVRMLLRDSQHTIILLDKQTYAGRLDNLGEAVDSSRLTIVKGDICDYPLVFRCCEDTDSVIHFAAESHVDNSLHRPFIFTQTNVFGTNCLLEASLQCRHSRFLYVSTDEVYGSKESGESVESDPIAPSNVYSASKAGGEHLAMAYFKTHGLNVGITRSCNNFGPNQHEEKFIPKVIINSIIGKKIPLYGSGNNVREWIPVEENCEKIWGVFFRGAPGETYNIGSGKRLSNIEIANRIVHIFGASPSLIESVPDRKGHDLRYAINDEKLSHLIDVERRDFDNSLWETIGWYLKKTTHMPLHKEG